MPAARPEASSRYGFERQHGEQEMSVWNGHYECTCYQFGDLERCARGNVHSADGWEGVLKPVLARYRGKVSRLYFRADAGFANPEVYGYLEDEGIKYAIRLPANRVLHSAICSNAPSADNQRGTCEQWYGKAKARSD